MFSRFLTPQPVLLTISSLRCCTLSYCSTLPDEDLEVLRVGCFKYFELGGRCVRDPVSLLSGWVYTSQIISISSLISTIPMIFAARRSHGIKISILVHSLHISVAPFCILSSWWLTLILCYHLQHSPAAFYALHPFLCGCLLRNLGDVHSSKTSYCSCLRWYPERSSQKTGYRGIPFTTGEGCQGCKSFIHPGTLGPLLIDLFHDSSGRLVSCLGLLFGASCSNMALDAPNFHTT